MSSEEAHDDNPFYEAKESPEAEKPSGASRALGESDSERSSKMPSPRKALLWAECYLCHKKVPLVRIKAHIRLRHPDPMIIQNAPRKEKTDEKLHPISTITPHKKQMNLLDLSKEPKQKKISPNAKSARTQ